MKKSNSVAIARPPAQRRSWGPPPSRPWIRPVSAFSGGWRVRLNLARALMTPDEILAMPEDRQILFISGRGLKPIQIGPKPFANPPAGSVWCADWGGIRRELGA